MSITLKEPAMAATVPWYQWCILPIGAALLLGMARADEPTFSKKTYVFKTVAEVKIQADVYRAEDRKTRPVLVWLHGGALIVGSRNSVPRQLLDLCKSNGFALVSFDYRLAPEAKLP